MTRRPSAGADRLRVIGRDEMPEWIGGTRYLAALHDPEAGHLNPLKLALGLAQTIERTGGRIFEQSRVLDCRETAGGYVARTARGEVRADVLVLACNAYVDRLDRDLARRLLPVGTYQVATAPLAPDVARSLLPQNSCVIDNQFVPDYFRLADNRLLFGGGCTYLGGIPADIAAATRPHLERVFPQLAGVPIDYAWGGHIDISMRRAPDIGRHGQRFWLQGSRGTACCRRSPVRARWPTRCSATNACSRSTSASATRASPAATGSPRRWKRSASLVPSARYRLTAPEPTMNEQEEIESLAILIRDLRKHRKVTLNDLAERIGRSVGFLSQVERGLSRPTVADLTAIGEALGVPTTYFYSLSKPRSVPW